MGNLDAVKVNEEKRKIALEKGQEQEFTKLFKLGIYKELNKRGILTDFELNSITSQ